MLLFHYSAFFKHYRSGNAIHYKGGVSREIYRTHYSINEIPLYWLYWQFYNNL